MLAGHMMGASSVDIAAARGRIVTLGEALVDMLPLAQPAHGSPSAYQPAAGGAPANVAVGVARLGAPAGFVGRVGDDAFGRFLLTTLEDAGVDVSQVRTTTERTALAFVTLGEGGERDFAFYRENSADLSLTTEDIDADYLKAAAFLHVGSLSLTSEPARSATLAALRVAHSFGVPRSVDPNLRLGLWPSPDAARREIAALLPHATLIKLSEGELAFLTGATTERAARSLMGVETALLCVTHGAAGTTYYSAYSTGSVTSFPVTPVDTTGAGDAFVAALLVGLWQLGDWPAALSDTPTIERVVKHANAFAALTVTKQGAIPALPNRAELARFLASQDADPT